MGVVVRRYIDFLIKIITYLYSTCISFFFGGSIPTFRYFLNCFFVLKKEECKSRFFTSRNAHVNCAVIHTLDWKSAVKHDGGV